MRQFGKPALKGSTTTKKCIKDLLLQWSLDYIHYCCSKELLFDFQHLTDSDQLVAYVVAVDDLVVADEWNYSQLNYGRRVNLANADDLTKVGAYDYQSVEHTVAHRHDEDQSLRY